MSDEGTLKPRRPELSAVLRRYGRRSSSARRAEPPRLETWQRVVDLVARDPAAETEAPRAASAPARPAPPPDGDLAPPAAAEGAGAAPPGARTSPAQPVRESQPTLDALAEATAVAVAAAAGAAADEAQSAQLIELATPAGASLCVVGVVGPAEQGLVRVTLAAAPANDAALLAALSALAAGGAAAPQPDPGDGGAGPLGDRPTSEHPAFGAAAEPPTELEPPGGRGPKRGGAAARLLDRPLRRPPEVRAPTSPPPSAKELLGVGTGGPRPLRAAACPWIGIDLGTLFARAAVVCGDEVEPIVDERGLPSIPALVSFPAPGEVLVGQPVAAQLGSEARWTVAPRRMLGRSASETERAAVSGDSALRIFAGDGGVLCLDAHGAEYSGTELCALVLAQVRAAARHRVGGDVASAVFTVPVGFDNRQRAALRAAAEQAGLAVKAMITEPSAALLGCGLRGGGGRAGFLSLGATFSFSVVELGETSFHVIAAGGDLTLGGEAVDSALAEQLAERCVAQHGADPRDDVQSWDRLLWACSAAKEVLSVRESVEVGFPPRPDGGPVRFPVTRADLWPVLEPLVARALALTDELLGRFAIRPAELGALVLGGGLCRIPAVRQMVHEHLAQCPIGGVADLAVARGAAQRAADLAGTIARAPAAVETLAAAVRPLGLSIAGAVVPLVFPPAGDGGPARRRVATERDQQTEIVVAICEAVPGEGWRVVRQLRYAGLPARPAGEAAVELSLWRESPQELRIIAAVSGREYETRIRLG